MPKSSMRAFSSSLKLLSYKNKHFRWEERKLIVYKCSLRRTSSIGLGDIFLLTASLSVLDDGASFKYSTIPQKVS